MGFTTDDSAIKGKVLRDDGAEIDFEDMKREDVVTFPGDKQFIHKYLVDSPPHFSLDRVAGTYEIRLIQIN